MDTCSAEQDKSETDTKCKTAPSEEAKNCESETRQVRKSQFYASINWNDNEEDLEWIDQDNDFYCSCSKAC